ncbi:M50 family metallopeptidase [Luteolibacter marinus]|uniref:M50 family metallopeptidase n=1 Tax=Luteolibacter marinus TaxID=2776705 RepID=UPI001D02D3D9|nr:M50 family metallopeptidase [Luteolibacter marinus]
MVRFTLFGIPVIIHPWFWLTLAFLGGLFDAVTPERMLYMSLFVFAGTISILVHEFGHALTGRRLGGGMASIELLAFGGLAYNQGGRFTRSQRFWMIAAGPGAGFLLLLLLILLLIAAFGPFDGLSLVQRHLFGSGSGLSERTADFFRERVPLLVLIRHFLWINFWWGILNLLPISPLDGGQITALFVRPQRRVHQIAIAAAALVVFFAIAHHQLYMALLFGFLGWKNMQAIQMKVR